MTCRVLIIGGYGNFGGYIARALASDPDIALLIGGRSRAKADEFAAGLGGKAQGCAIDIGSLSLPDDLKKLRPDVVIHTVGPFQGQDHRVARAAIQAGSHYLDLADARDFVATIGELDEAARKAEVAVISGASSVPCMSAAFIDRYRPEFGELRSVSYGITAAQATNRGLGTAAAILSYLGRPFTILRHGHRKRVFGWQGLRAVRYPELGKRLFGYCDVPDLAIFPDRYPELRDIEFLAGHEVKILHLGTWLLSWIARGGLVKGWSSHSKRLLKMSFLFDPLGSDRSGFHMFLDGRGKDGEPMRVTIFMIARQAHGPNIPCMPAILLARRIASGSPPPPGARPCLNLLTLDELLDAVADLDITTTATGPGIDHRRPS